VCHAPSEAGREPQVRPGAPWPRRYISLTLNVYSHVLPDMGDAAAGGMDAALG
jgi:hypothetical protein